MDTQAQSTDHLPLSGLDIILLITASVLSVGATIVAQNTATTEKLVAYALSIFSNGTTLIISVYITYRFSKIQAGKEIGQVSHLAMGHLQNLHSDITSLLIEMKRFLPTKSPASTMLTSSLSSISKDIKQSLYDIDVIAGREVEEFRKIVLHNTVPCKTKGCRNDIVVECKEDIGATAIAECASCSARFYVHRRRDGVLMYGGDINNGGFSQAHYAGTLSADMVTTQVKCPNEKCDNVIPVTYKAGSTYAKRGCPECLTNFSYSVIDNATSVMYKVQNRYISAATLERGDYMQCACGGKLPVTGFVHNKAHTLIGNCFRCGALYIAVEAGRPTGKDVIDGLTVQ